MAYILESIIAGSEYQASRMVRVHVFHILLFSYLVSLLLSNGEGRGKCPSSFNCGDLGTIQFPFTTIERPDCGILALHGCGDDSGIQLKEGELYDVIHIDHFTIFVRDYSLHKSLQSRSCEIFNSKFTPNLPPTSPLASFDMKYNVTMFRCDKSLHIPLPKLLFNYTNCSSYNIYYFRRKLELPGSYKPPSSFTGCSTIQLPVKNEDDNNDPFTFLTADVPIEVRLSDECAKCYHHDRGLCQLDSEGKFLCAKEDSRPVKKLIIIATATSAAGVAVLMMFLSCCFRRKIYSWTSLSFHKKENQMNKMIEVLLKENGHLPIRSCRSCSADGLPDLLPQKKDLLFNIPF
ncbi:hypothetical protein L6164_001687 [Bauhinia variegata]|uniref:Uncharacterized protein n=1 Tax=Bauhinia variegata TaxID=167791 RepID=A0ACB9QAA3_BAUVA|nr:hypothetical protein L6164_001687 [Bauhinia variegata]